MFNANRNLLVVAKNNLTLLMVNGEFVSNNEYSAVGNANMQETP